MKATNDQYYKAVEVYVNEGASAVFRYAMSIGVDEHSYCPDCEEDTPDCEDDCCLVCGSYKREQQHDLKKTQIRIIATIEELTSIWDAEWANKHVGKTYEATIAPDGWAQTEGAQFPPGSFVESQ